MSFTHQWKDEGVLVTYSGDLSSEDIIKSNSTLIGSAQYEKIKYILSDFSHITAVKVNDIDVEITRLFATKVSHYNHNVKVALISSHQTLQILIEKYIAKTLEDIPGAQQKLFDNLTEARQWATA